MTAATISWTTTSITPFPRTRAMVSAVADHSVEGFREARAATTTSGATRLEHLARSASAFDHAITDSSDSRITRYLLGGAYSTYSTVKTAIIATIASGAIAGARQIVGATDLGTSERELATALKLQATPNVDPIGHLRAVDWVQHAREDALTGVVMLRHPVIGFQLNRSLQSVERTISGGRLPSDEVLAQLTQLYGAARSDLAGQIAAAQAARA